MLKGHETTVLQMLHLRDTFARYIKEGCFVDGVTHGP